MSTSAEVYDAVCALMALPDLPCLPKRGRRYLLPGDARRRDAIKRELAHAYVSWRLAEAGRAESSIVCVRRSPLRLVGERKRA